MTIHPVDLTEPLASRPADSAEGAAPRHGASADVSRKLLSEELKLAHFMIESSVDAFHLTDAQARFIRVNEASTRLLGYAREELLTMTVHDVDPNFPVSGWPAAWAELRARRSFSRESVLRCKSGELLPVELTINYFLFEGQEYSFTVVRDISQRLHAERERLALEQQLQQSQKLEAIGTLTSGIAHNFNNMLAVILGSAELARLSIPSDHPASPRLDSIQEASARAANLVAQMMTFARRRPGPRRIVSLPSVLEQAIKLLRNAIPSSIELRAQFDDDVPCVLADEAQLQQVLNLPVLVLSGDVSESTTTKLLTAGAHGVLQKPWPAGSLEAAIAAMARPKQP